LSGFELKRGIVVTAGKKPHLGNLGVLGKKIISAKSGGGIIIDLREESYVYPALINTHDHLQGNYRPAIGPKKGAFYLTWQPWDNDLKSSSTYTERSKLTREELYLLSSYKCIFSGVTTVNDHFPQAINGNILPTLPIRAISEYALAHEATSYDLKWGEGVAAEHKKAVKNKWPFITHLCEGFDEESMHSLETLEKLGVLDSHCLLVHCIAMSDEDIVKAAKAGVSVSICPTSNMLMFNVTAKIRKMIKAGLNLTLGTDSSASGSANLLEEIRNLRNFYRNMYGEELEPKKIFEMVTINSAKAFWMQDQIGSLDDGKLADIMVLKARKDDPYENLICASMEDIELLTLAGKPIYGETRFIGIFSDSKIPKGYTEITVGKRPMFVIGDPAALYREIRRRTGFKKVLDFLPFEPSSQGQAKKPVKPRKELT
jgi:cytosine/adenosine deaminase-related metal-dependent hydrolase